MAGGKMLSIENLYAYRRSCAELEHCQESAEPKALKQAMRMEKCDAKFKSFPKNSSS
jgi:hypothetical protein